VAELPSLAGSPLRPCGRHWHRRRRSLGRRLERFASSWRSTSSSHSPRSQTTRHGAGCFQLGLHR
jgi:hypothetical protein